jgi:hypothetical protein
MFEVFGPFARPTPSIVPLLLACLPIVAGMLAFVPGRRVERRAAIFLALGAIASAIAFVTSANLVRHLGLAARVADLDLVLALDLDPLASLACAVASLVAIMLVLRQRHARRVALTCVTLAAIEFVAMADSAALLVLAAAIASLVAGALGYVRPSHFVADRIADATLVAATALLFWTLGGAWVSGDWVPDLEPRVVVASSAPNVHGVPEDDDDDDKPHEPTLHRGARASLSFAGMPNAMVLVDGTWLRDARGGHVVRAPFADAPIAAGPHTIRIRVGAGSDDYYIPRVESAEGDHVLLAVRGATTTFRTMQDDLVARDASGTSIGRDAIARRRWFGVSCSSIVLALVCFAFAARARLFPFAPSRDEPARALLAIGAIVALVRFPLGNVASWAPWLACALGACAIISAARALRKRDASALLAAEIAIAATACVSGVPAMGVLHACIAALVFARPAPSPNAHAVLLPTRIGVVASLAVAPCAIVLVASWLAACALGRHDPARARTPIAIALDVLLTASATAAFFFAPSALASSFRASTPPAPPSVPLALLVCAIVAFAWSVSRTRPRALDRLASARVLAWIAACGDLPARATSAMGIAIGATIHEVDARLVALVAWCDRSVRSAAVLVSFADDVALVRSTKVLRVPFPSERIARAALVAFAVVALAAFVVPWAS